MSMLGWLGACRQGPFRGCSKRLPSFVHVNPYGLPSTVQEHSGKSRPKPSFPVFVLLDSLGDKPPEKLSFVFVFAPDNNVGFHGERQETGSDSLSD